MALMYCRANVSPPTATIRFVDLTVETEVFADLSRNLPSILRAIRDPIEVTDFKSSCLNVPSDTRKSN